MKKEEILEASRNENKKKDLYEMEIENKAVKIAALALIILATIFYVAEITIKGVTNYGWYAMIALYCTILYGYKAIKIKKTFHFVCTGIWLIVTALCVYSYIVEVIATLTIL